MLKNKWLVIKSITDEQTTIFTQRVNADDLNDALNEAEDQSDWKETNCDDARLEGIAIYSNDIQAIEEK